jgi:Ran GTPase-activating protein (RanGAP) involved in mRNA processing and transport
LGGDTSAGSAANSPKSSERLSVKLPSAGGGAERGVSFRSPKGIPRGTPKGPLKSPKGTPKSAAAALNIAAAGDAADDPLASFPSELQDAPDDMFFAAGDPFAADGDNPIGDPSRERKKASFSPTPPASSKTRARQGRGTATESKTTTNDGADDQDDTPASRMFKKSMGRTTPLRKSFQKSREGAASKKNRKTRETAFAISDVVSSVMDEINQMQKEEDDDNEGDESTASFNRHSHLHTHVDHRVVAGEDFTFADVLARVDENDADLATLVLRQTGQNMKNFDILIDDDTGESVQKETVTLVLPMHLTTSKLSDFAASVNNNSHLRFIDLRGNGIGDDSVTELSASLRSNAKFRALDLSHNKITGVGAASLVQLVNKRLQFLNLSFNPVGDAGAQKLAGGIANSTMLRELNLADCNFNAYGATFLASAFAVNKSLQTIILNNNSIGSSQACKRIAFALMRNVNLRVLKIGGTGLSEGIEHIARLVETTKSLTTLDLSANSITDEGVAALGNALTFNKSIRSLCLKRNKIGNDGIATVSAALVANNVLEVLDVGGNIIGDEGIGKLATVLRSSTSLLELDVSDNQIGVDGAIELSDVLRSNEKLAILNVAANNIESFGVMRIEEALKINTTLQVCYVGIEAVGLEGLGEMTNHANNNLPFWQSRMVVL